MLPSGEGVIVVRFLSADRGSFNSKESEKKGREAKVGKASVRGKMNAVQ